jgi:hypothetical protein
MRDPMLCNRRPVAQPDPLMSSDMIEEPYQSPEPPGTAYDATMETDRHHARAPLRAASIQPVERIPAVVEEIIAGTEVRASL